MKALLFHGPGDLRLEEVPKPEPGPGDVLVEIEVADEKALKGVDPAPAALKKALARRDPTLFWLSLACVRSD